MKPPLKNDTNQNAVAAFADNNISQFDQETPMVNTRPGIAIYNPDLRHQKSCGRQSKNAHLDEDIRSATYPSSSRKGLKFNGNSNNKISMP